jgi:hypothetical protein
MKKALKISALYIKFFTSGERGIRTPGPVTVNGFQDRRIRPLCHLSGAKIGVAFYLTKNLRK